MKKLLRAISVLLTLALTVLLLASCMARLDDVEDEEPPKTNAELILGTWETEIDFTEFLNAEFANEGDMGYYVQVDGIKMNFIMTFDDHGNFEASFDSTSVKQAMEKLKDDLAEGIEKYFMDVAKDIGVSYNYFLTNYLGMSVEEYVDMIYADDDPMDIEGMTSRGKYRLENGKIYTWELSEVMNENEYETYSLNGNELKFIESFSDDEESESASRYFMPMVFKRVK